MIRSSPPYRDLFPELCWLCKSPGGVDHAEMDAWEELGNSLSTLHSAFAAIGWKSFLHYFQTCFLHSSHLFLTMTLP